MKRSIAVLKTYFETGDTPTQQQFWDFLDSFFHKDAGVIITGISNTEELITLTYSNGSTSEIPITALPSSVDPDFVNGLEAFMDTVTDFITGNTKTDNNFSDQNLSDLLTLLDFMESYTNPPVTSVNSKTGAVVLHSDDISDTGRTHKFVSSSEKSNWNGKLTNSLPATQVPYGSTGGFYDSSEELTYNEGRFIVKKDEVAALGVILLDEIGENGNVHGVFSNNDTELIAAYEPETGQYLYANGKLKYSSTGGAKFTFYEDLYVGSVKVPLTFVELLGNGSATTGDNVITSDNLKASLTLNEDRAKLDWSGTKGIDASDSALVLYSDTWIDTGNARVDFKNALIKIDAELVDNEAGLYEEGGSIIATFKGSDGGVFQYGGGLFTCNLSGNILNIFGNLITGGNLIKSSNSALNSVVDINDSGIQFYYGTDGAPEKTISMNAGGFYVISDEVIEFTAPSMTLNGVPILLQNDGIFDLKVDKGVDNLTTVALTSANLNSLYPTATVGFRVYCANIVGGAMVYEKRSAGWIGQACIIP